ncbi:MAG: hypothetical protein NT069_23905, partial [Planctomycetota bacterium]|nr:hypothetical protein [Planctomycetota bacterium]
ETQLSVGELSTAQLSGRLEIPEGRVLPGPLFDQLGEVVGLIESAIRRIGASGDLLQLDKPLATISNQAIDFELHDGRLFHSLAVVQLRKVAVGTVGSVGLD